MRTVRAVLPLLFLAACSGAGVPAGPSLPAAATARPQATGAAAATALTGLRWSFEDERLPEGFVADAGVPWRVECGAPTADQERLRTGALASLYGHAAEAEGLLAQLGGDYWKGPLDPAQEGRCRLETRDAAHPAGGSGAGQILSAPFRPAGGFVSFLVGAGGGDRTRVELCAEGPRGCEAVPSCGDEGPGMLGMRRVICDVEALGLAGKTVRLRVTDATARAPSDYRGHRFLSVDDVRLEPTRPRPQASPAWGFADLHAHFFGHLGHGGRLIHGEVEGPLRDALADCEQNHGRNGRAFSTEFNPAGHTTRGYPEFKGWPRYGSVAHQQAHVDWIERAYRGGLRLVQVDVGHSRVFARAYEKINGSKLLNAVSTGPLVAPLPDGKLIHPSDEDSARREQLDAMRSFAEDHGDWMAIATSPAEARAALRQGKLVLVPGLEADEPGEGDRAALEAAARAGEAEMRRAVREYVKKLHGEGVRHVFPIHVMPNLFGAPAVYSRLLYCSQIAHNGALSPLADAMGDGVRYHVGLDRTSEPLVEFAMEVAMSALLRPDNKGIDLRALAAAARKDTAKSCHVRLEETARTRAAAPPGAAPTADVATLRAKGKAVAEMGSTMSAGGLTPLGEVMIIELMRAGMLIDLTHMSLRARAEVLTIAERYGYPLMASHGGFRELAFGNTASPTAGAAPALAQGPFKASDYKTSRIARTTTEAALSRDEVRRLKALGGTFGLGLGSESDGVEWRVPGATAVANDCDGTSKSFAQRFRYALTEAGAGITLGTDVNGFAGLPPPRFGKEACHGADGDKERGKAGRAKQEEHTRVEYVEEVAAPGAPGADRLLQYRVPGAKGRVFDVNEDGVAHYGLLPDFLQDMKNAGVAPGELAALFRGVEDYLRMWERVEEARKAVLKEYPE